MVAEQPVPERRPSPALTPTTLSSNNPFRTALDSQQPRTSSVRPMSRNPFLSTFEAEFNKEAKKTGDLIDMSASVQESPQKATFGGNEEELLKGLSINDEDKKHDEPERRRPPPPRPAPARSGTDSRTNRRASRSNEDERDKVRGPPRGPPRPRGPPGARLHPSSPERRRMRRNSESSMVDKGSLDAREERKRRERRKERDERSRDSKSTSTRRVRKPQGLDLIDKLDVTGIYGPSMIHHDGPYDAVQPHRNRKKDRRAPMEAFPLGSANNSLGGSGPVNSKIDLDRIHGRGAEGFTDFGGAEAEWKKPPRVETEFSPKARADIVHGEQSHGLGTSTFLEGAPASRKAIEQETENQQKLLAEGGGIGRKKSIAQRFRGISQPRRYVDGPRITSPEVRASGTTSPQGSFSAGPISQTKGTEKNPFFDDYDEAYDAKGATTKPTEPKGNSAPPSPGHNSLQRAITSDNLGSPTTTEPKPVGGFLNRVKSLRGGRRRPA